MGSSRIRPGRRHNPEESFYAEIEKRKAEGKRRAERHRDDIEDLVGQGRMGASSSTLNMIRALKLMPYKNTIEDWQRLFEAEMAVRFARTRQRTMREYLKTHGGSARRRNPTIGTEVFEEGMGYSFQLVEGGKAYLSKRIHPSRIEAAKALQTAQTAYAHGRMDTFNRLTTPFRGRTYKVSSISTKRGRAKAARKHNPSTSGWPDNHWINVRATDGKIWCRQGSKKGWSDVSVWHSGMRGMATPFHYATNRQAGLIAKRLAGMFSPTMILTMTWDAYRRNKQSGRDPRTWE